MSPIPWRWTVISLFLSAGFLGGEGGTNQKWRSSSRCQAKGGGARWRRTGLLPPHRRPESRESCIKRAKWIKLNAMLTNHGKCGHGNSESRDTSGALFVVLKLFGFCLFAYMNYHNYSQFTVLFRAASDVDDQKVMTLFLWPWKWIQRVEYKIWAENSDYFSMWSTIMLY